MPRFAYTALTADGAERIGTLNAADLTDARRQLRGRALMPLSMDLATGAEGLDASAPSRGLLTRHLWVRPRDLQFFFRQMALLVASGHRVRQSLEIAAALVERDRLDRSISRMVERIDAGSSFADALTAEKGLVPAFVPPLVHAGEQSGTLDRVLDDVAKTLEANEALRNSLIRALLFPLITLAVAFAILFFIVFWLVPRLTDFLARTRADIHWSMQLLIDVADFLQFYGRDTALIVLAIVAALRLGYMFPAVRLAEDRALLSTPLFGPTLRLFEMARFASVGAMLAASGLRQVEMLKILSVVTQNAAYRALYLQAADRLLTGATLSSSLAAPIFPRLMRHMVSLGEKTGSTDDVLSRAAAFYADEVETRIRVMVGSLVPAVTILVGVVVAVIYLAVLVTVLTAYNSLR
ncbi:MAG: type II secretion system F family protein [Pseudomonadota bacterium]